MAQPYSDARDAHTLSPRDRRPSRPTNPLSQVFLAAIVSLMVVACGGEDADNASDSAIPDDVATPAATMPPSELDRESVWETFDRAKAERLTATARLLAGLDPESTSVSIDTAAWTNYSAQIAAAWGQLEATQLEPLRAWREENMAQVPGDAPVLYPFSGPDFLYASSFFPTAPVYVMVGLEPIGALPQLENASAEELTSIFDWVNTSLYALLNFSFFRTNSMEKDLADRGTLPILLLFAARNGYDILDVNYVGIDDKGKVKRLETGNPEKLTPGIRLDLLKNDGDKPQQLYYFSTDLSDAGFEANPGLEKFFGQLDRPVAYLKAAAYLMHNEYFSIIRNTLIERSQFVLQDDSGIPLRFFDANNWSRSFFGVYNGPIELFATRFQADLKAEFTDNTNISALPFGIGYKYQGDSNLMLAERQGEPPQRGDLDSPYDLMSAAQSSEAAEGSASEDDADGAGNDSDDGAEEKAAPVRRDREKETAIESDDTRDDGVAKEPDDSDSADRDADKARDDVETDADTEELDEDETRVPLPEAFRNLKPADETEADPDAEANVEEDAEAEAEPEEDAAENADDEQRIPKPNL